ncbi:UDP-3-O-acyl-N-acetylglucosamine deacetylase [Candidatus Nomurabacteria bacterium]|nr:UDP-3-O-acyl-N-acetylglucosamine deacetylase [Candidatus Nomurabacteria bacterium]
MIKRKILTKEVTVTGPNFWGFNSSITFKPAERPGWFLRTKTNGDVPVDFRIAVSKKGRLELSSGGTELAVIEHIIALKMLIGLDQVILIVHNKWPPYLGGASGYIKQLKGSWVQTDEDFPFIKPNDESYVNTFNSIATEVSIKKSEGFLLHLHSKWKDLPRINFKVTLEDLGLIQEFIEAKPQGFPHWRKHFANLASFFGWPNIEYVSWKNKNTSVYETARKWWAHAGQDAFGELGLCDYKAIPLVNCFRYNAGHKETLEAVKKAFS